MNRRSVVAAVLTLSFMSVPPAACTDGGLVGADELPVKPADTAIVKRITGFTAPRRTRLPGFRQTKPMVIETREALTEVFGKTETDKIAKQVDFEKQFLVFFQWAGSGQDKLMHTIQNEDDAPKAVFVFKPGRTRDLRPHTYLFSIVKEVAWEIAE